MRRRPGVGRQEFHDHWRHPHGTLGRQIPGLVTYVQAQQVDTATLDEGQREYEAVAISSFDSPRAAAALALEPQYVEHVAPDEESFQDIPKGRFFSTEEEVLVSRMRAEDAAHPADTAWNELERPSSVQLLQFVHREGRPEWAGDDDELGRRIHAFRHARNRPSVAVHGDDAPFLGARQLWWPTLSGFERGVAAGPAAFRELVDRAGRSVTMLVVSERFVR